MGKINRTQLSAMADSLRKELGEDSFSPIDIFSSALRIENLTVVYQPFSENISGIFCREEGFFLIAINSGMTLGRQRFSMAHELYHYRFDDTMKAAGTVVCPKNIDGDDINERKADTFASFFLIPQNSLYEQLTRRNFAKKGRAEKLEDIIYLEQYYQVSHQAMIMRLWEDEYISTFEKNSFITSGVTRKAAKLGYSTQLYEKSMAPVTATYGYYVNLAGKLLEKDLISEKRYAEYLKDASREDILTMRVEEEALE